MGADSASSQGTSAQSDYSGTGERVTLLILLFAAGRRSEALVRDFPSSAIQVAYAACLLLMVAATLRALGRSRRSPASTGTTGSLSGAESDWTSATGWHVPRTFTDPLFQLPAAFCMIVLLVDLGLELVAEPPQSEAGLWFLAGMAALVLAVAGVVLWRAGQSNEPGGTVPSRSPTEEPPTEQQETYAFQDPWFAVPAVVTPLILTVRPILERIEEGNVLWWLDPLIVGFVGALALAAFLLYRQRRKERKAAAQSDQPSLDEYRDAD